MNVDKLREILPDVDGEYKIVLHDEDERGEYKKSRLISRISSIVDEWRDEKSASYVSIEISLAILVKSDGKRYIDKINIILFKRGKDESMLLLAYNSNNDAVVENPSKFEMLSDEELAEYKVRKLVDSI